MRRALAWLALAIALPVGAKEPASQRIVTLGGTPTEIAFALGLGDQVVGVDQSSLYPDAARALPQVGYYRAVSAEGILSLRPTLVVASEEAGPPAALELIRSAGVEVVLLPAASTPEAARERIRLFGSHAGAKAQAGELIARLDADLAAARSLVACVQSETTPALFLFARGGGGVAAAGRETAAQALLELAGATNTMGAGYKGYRPVSAEAVIQAAPVALITTTHAVATMGGAEGALALPGMALTPAGKAKKVVVLDDLLALGFGPRLGQAVRTLAASLAEGRACAAGG